MHCRVLSSLQFEIEKFEENLVALDMYDLEHDDRKLTKRAYDKKRSPEDFAKGQYPPEFKKCRPELLSELRGKLIEYGKSNFVTHTCSKWQYADRTKMSSY